MWAICRWQQRGAFTEVSVFGGSGWLGEDLRKTGLNDIHPFIYGSFNPSVHLEAFFESLLYTRYTRGVIDVERKVAAPALEFSLKKATGKRHSPFRVGSSMKLWENGGRGGLL